MRALSVCVVTQQYQSIFSGIGSYARNLVAGLLSQGHRVTLVAPTGQLPSDSRVRCVAVPEPRFSSSQARWFPLALSFRRALAAEEARERFDLVHFTDARESWLCRPHCPAVGDVQDTYAAEAGGPGYYRRYYDDWVTRWAYYRLVKLCEADAYPRLDAVIANSRYTADKVAAAYRLDRRKLTVCYKTVDAAHWAQARGLRTGQARRGRRLIFVGGNFQRKGLPALIRAAAALAPEFPDLAVSVVGADKAAGTMQALAETLGVQDRFVFAGWKSQDELVPLYAQADAFVMPSLTEGFGYVFFEAMAAGLPVIGSTAGGIAEVVESGRNGLLVPPDAPAALAAAIRALLTDAALYARLQTAGFATSAQFSLERMLGCTLGVYERVLGNA